MHVCHVLYQKLLFIITNMDNMIFVRVKTSFASARASFHFDNKIAWTNIAIRVSSQNLTRICRVLFCVKIIGYWSLVKIEYIWWYKLYTKCLKGFLSRKFSFLFLTGRFQIIPVISDFRPLFWPLGHWIVTFSLNGHIIF